MEEIKMLLAVGILMLLCIGLIGLCIYVNQTDKKQKAEERKQLVQELRKDVFEEVIKYFKDSKEEHI